MQEGKGRQKQVTRRMKLLCCDMNVVMMLLLLQASLLLLRSVGFWPEKNIVQTHSVQTLPYIMYEAVFNNKNKSNRMVLYT